MYSVVLLAAVTSGGESPEFLFRRGGCRGGCVGSVVVVHAPKGGCNGAVPVPPPAVVPPPRLPTYTPGFTPSTPGANFVPPRPYRPESFSPGLTASTPGANFVPPVAPPVPFNVPPVVAAPAAPGLTPSTPGTNFVPPPVAPPAFSVPPVAPPAYAPPVASPAPAVVPHGCLGGVIYGTTPMAMPAPVAHHGCTGGVVYHSTAPVGCHGSIVVHGSCCGAVIHSGCCGTVVHSGCCGSVVVTPAKEESKKEEPKKEEKKKKEVKVDEEESEQVSNSAQIIISVPATATVTFDGVTTKTTGEVRTFATPELETGKTFSYTVEAKFLKDDKEVVVTKTVEVTAGKTTKVDLNSGEAVAGN